MAENKQSDPDGGKTPAEPEIWPSVRQDDAVEHRSFDPAADAPTPKSEPDAPLDSRMGPKGDPAEGKRKP